jgi:hypothetical protein
MKLRQELSERCEQNKQLQQFRESCESLQTRTRAATTACKK